MMPSKMHQYVSSDGDVVWAPAPPAKNWRVLPFQPPGEWEDGDSVLIQYVPDRMGWPIFVELSWNGKAWERTEKKPFTGFDVPRIRRESDDKVFAVDVDDDGNILSEDRWK